VAANLAAPVGTPTPIAAPIAAPVVPAAPAAPVVGMVPAPAPAVPAAIPAALFIQAGAFADPANAERLAAQLRGGSFGTIFVRDDIIAGRRMYRVRIGPVPNVPEFDRIVAALERAGVHDAHLALN
jgi:rare lipoprotein A